MTDTIRPGQYLGALVSSDGRFTFIMQQVEYYHLGSIVGFKVMYRYYLPHFIVACSLGSTKFFSQRFILLYLRNIRGFCDCMSGHRYGVLELLWLKEEAQAYESCLLARQNHKKPAFFRSSKVLLSCLLRTGRWWSHQLASSGKAVKH